MRTVPRRPVDAPMIATGLPLNGWSGGREAQSMAFCSTPGTAWLYSGETKSSPSAAAMAARSARADSG